jgi:hypothetical protein
VAGLSQTLVFGVNDMKYYGVNLEGSITDYEYDFEEMEAENEEEAKAKAIALAQKKYPGWNWQVSEIEEDGEVKEEINNAIVLPIKNGKPMVLPVKNGNVELTLDQCAEILKQ